MKKLKKLIDGEIVDMSDQEVSDSSIPLKLYSTTGDVKAECRRRILLVMSEDQQRNTLAAGQAATMLYGADPAGWPPELRARQAAAMAAWGEIERLRARSNEIEALEPIPTQVHDDVLWQTVDV